MRVRNGKDFWTGLMFIAFGLIFFVTALGYSLGSSIKMGPGYFPAILGALLTLIGVTVVIRSCAYSSEYPFKIFQFRPSLLISSVVIGLISLMTADLFDHEGLFERVLPALALLTFIGSFGPRSMFMVLLAVVTFGYAVGTFGIVISTTLLILMSASGSWDDFRRNDLLILIIVLGVFAPLVFVKGLGLPLSVLPGG